jgi:glycosyltransferase involved in cell wall biosynthesis
MADKLDISVVVPLYNEEESLPELCEWIAKVMMENKFSYEVLLIDDGSTDHSWEVIEKIHAANHHIKGIRFNRNYGKSAALNTGFDTCKGEVVITMDADLQDSPDEIPDLVKMIKQERFDLVSGWKKERFDPISKTIPTKLYNFVTRQISGIALHDMNCGLKAYRKEVVKAVDVYGEMHRYIPVMAKWNGFKKIGEKVVQHRPRKYGTTKFGLERFIFGPLDLLSITFVTKYKKRPMHFFGTLGILSFLLGFMLGLYLLWEKIDALYISKVHIHRDITEKPAFFVALVLLIIGVQLFLTGFIGEMMTMNSDKKNDYIVSEKVG